MGMTLLPKLLQNPAEAASTTVARVPLRGCPAAGGGHGGDGPGGDPGGDPVGDPMGDPVGDPMGENPIGYPSGVTEATEAKLGPEAEGVVTWMPPLRSWVTIMT